MFRARFAVSFVPVLALVVAVESDAADPVHAPFAGALAESATAFAPPTVSRKSAEVEVDAFLGGRKPISRGSVASRRSAKISVGGRRTATVGEIADLAFREHDTFTAEAKRGRAALAGEPVVLDEVVEVDDSTIFTRSTAMTVVDPEAFRQQSPTFASARGGKGTQVPLAKLSGEAKADLATYKAELAGFPATHPLRKAAEQGDQALLDAIAAGQGEFRVTTTVIVPKHAQPRDAKGDFVRPAFDQGGSFEFSKAVPDAGGKRDAPAAHEVVRKASVEESGSCTHTSDFLAGFTDFERWEWSRRWDVPTGYFRIHASAWYEFGLRIPIEITAVQTPNRATTTGGGSDVEVEVEVAMTAKAKDASTEFYQGVGLTGAEVHGGDEFVLDAGFAVTFTLHVLGIDIHKTLPSANTFDYSQDFVPPFANCGTNCGIDLWIPADVTRTSINILGIIQGSARAGVNLSGDGDINLDFQALVDGEPKQSWYPGSKTDAARKAALTFESPDTVRRRKMAVAAVRDPGDTRSYGYRLSDPSYDWTVVMTPGIRGDIDVNARPIFSDHFVIGPLWLDAAALELGKVHLERHAGTTSSVEYEHGLKRWKK